MKIRYTIGLARPHQHLIAVEMAVEGVPRGPFHVLMPEWIPGHYSLMNNARFVQDLRAYANGRAVPAWKTDKQTWEIETAGASKITIRYDLFARTLSSGASYFDDAQCHINGGNAFPYVLGHQDAPCTLTIADKPRDWKVATGLAKEGPNRWSAPSYDDFIDCPVKIGRFHHETFRVLGKVHHVVVSDLGDSVDRLPRFVKDTKAFVAWLGEMFDGLPYDEYWFLCDFHPTLCKGGALEHKNSTHLALPLRLDSEDEEDYHRIISVTCHEFFHTWNVKRIRPRALGPFDYRTEAHTTDLWIAEGLTDYYAWYALVRSGVLTPKQYLTWLARYVDNLHDMPGRASMTLREASWDTWTQSFWNSRLTFEETNSLNRYVDYYTKGAIVGAMLDVELRAATNARKGLEHVFRVLWKTADAPEGFETGEFEDRVESLAGAALRRRLEQWVGSTAELPYARTFAKAGLEFAMEPPTKEEEKRKGRRKIVGTLGIELDDTREFPVARNVDPGGPAAAAGLHRGDLLLAVDGQRLTRDDWRRLLKGAGRRALELSFFRGGRLRTVTVTPNPDARLVARFRVASKAKPEAARVRRAWLGPVDASVTTAPTPV